MRPFIQKERGMALNFGTVELWNFMWKYRKENRKKTDSFSFRKYLKSI